MAEKKCPMDKPTCVLDCQWNKGDKRAGNKCIVEVIADKLVEIADAIGAVKRTAKKQA